MRKCMQDIILTKCIDSDFQRRFKYGWIYPNSDLNSQESYLIYSLIFIIWPIIIYMWLYCHIWTSGQCKVHNKYWPPPHAGVESVNTDTVVCVPFWIDGDRRRGISFEPIPNSVDSWVDGVPSRDLPSTKINRGTRWNRRMWKYEGVRHRTSSIH